MEHNFHILNYESNCTIVSIRRKSFVETDFCTLRRRTSLPHIPFHRLIVLRPVEQTYHFLSETKQRTADHTSQLLTAWW